MIAIVHTLQLPESALADYLTTATHDGTINAVIAGRAVQITFGTPPGGATVEGLAFANPHTAAQAWVDKVRKAADAAAERYESKL